ncbi:MAG: ABC transporter ATP-binding protein [Bacteroidetes bacterium]|nr:ABC transporter ATP-binding protein [Bacteroidota bacterium]
MLIADSLYKSYFGAEVLRGVSLDVHESEIVSIVGPSGAGKTSLLYILGTLDNPDKGHLQFEGIDLSTLKGSELAHFRNENIGFVFQFHNLLPEFTSLENVAMPCYLAGIDRRDADDIAYEVLDLVGLEDKLSQKPSELSGGERQRVAVARALANDPKLILADEPTGSLDSKNAKKLYDIFFDIRDKLGKTIIYVTHDEYFADLADRKLEIVDGKVIS